MRVVFIDNCLDSVIGSRPGQKIIYIEISSISKKILNSVCMSAGGCGIIDTKTVIVSDHV